MMLIQRYCSDLDKDMLLSAIDLIQSELDAPTIQPGKITVRSLAEIEQSIKPTGGFTMKLDDADASEPVESGKLVRLVSSDPKEEGDMLILFIMFINSEEIVFTVPGES
jgi:hypothetical protein